MYVCLCESGSLFMLLLVKTALSLCVCVPSVVRLSSVLVELRGSKQSVSSTLAGTLTEVCCVYGKPLLDYLQKKLSLSV